MNSLSCVEGQSDVGWRVPFAINEIIAMLLSAEEFFSHVSGELNVEADVADVLTIVGGIRYCLRIENDVPTFK